MARRSPEQIKHLISEQSSGGKTIAEFCRSRGINTGTFYAWRAKYATDKQTAAAAAGFTRLVTPSSSAAAAVSRVATVYLPGGARLELTGWPVADLSRFTRELCSGDA